MDNAAVYCPITRSLSTYQGVFSLHFGSKISRGNLATIIITQYVGRYGFWSKASLMVSGDAIWVSTSCGGRPYTHLPALITAGQKLAGQDNPSNSSIDVNGPSANAWPHPNWARQSYEWSIVQNMPDFPMVWRIGWQTHQQSISNSGKISSIWQQMNILALYIPVKVVASPLPPRCAAHANLHQQRQCHDCFRNWPYCAIGCFRHWS